MLITQFHNGTGVRTVMGKVGQIDNGKSRPLYTVIMKTIRILPCHRPDYSTRIVKLTSTVRMLLKPGYKGVYVSRSFAIKAQLVDKKVRHLHHVFAQDEAKLTVNSTPWARLATLASARSARCPLPSLAARPAIRP
jgi:hypothetical protein